MNKKDSKIEELSREVATLRTENDQILPLIDENVSLNE